MRPRSLLLTLFGDYVYPLGHADVRVGTLVRLAEELGVSAGALRSALSRLTRDGWLVRRDDHRPTRYGLSDRGRHLIEDGIRRIYGHRQGWDGQWLLVSYSLAEHRRGQRDRLRAALTFSGFGSLGNGLYITPHDLRREVTELVAEHGLEDAVTSLRGHLTWPEDVAALVARAWNLEHINQRYRDFLCRRRELMALHLQALAAGELSDREAFNIRFRLTHEFRHFPFEDPDLPAELLPSTWLGGQARALFLEYNHGLRVAAERHYLELDSG